MYTDVFTLCHIFTLGLAFRGHLYQPSLPCFSDELATACVPLMLNAVHFCIVLSCWYEFISSTVTEIYENNLTCVAMGENQVRGKFSRHSNIRCHFVRELVKVGFVKRIPLHIHQTVAAADAFTKSLPSLAFIGYCRVMMDQTPFALKFLHS